MNITPEHLVFLLGSLAVPIILVVLNFIVRGMKGWYYTAGSDFFLTEMTFSFTSAILWKDMTPYIHNAYIREASPAIFIVLGLLILLCWVWTASRVEVQINEAVRQRAHPRSVPQGRLFIAWALVVSFFAAEIMSFVYR
jgi:hypothetical protein